jgi:IclR family pca regulon transcriptional regulator
MSRTKIVVDNTTRYEESIGREKSRPREFVQGLERGFVVIRAFSPDAPNLTIAQVSERTGFTRAVARRYLFTLQALGYVVQSGDRFSLTPRLLDLGFTYLSTLDITSVVQPFMEQVTSTLHESCSVSVLDGHEIVYVARRPAKRIMSINLALGSRLPAHATSMGKVLLAHLPPAGLDHYFSSVDLKRLTDQTVIDEVKLRAILAEVRELGWAIANEETEQGVRSVAAPIYDRDGEVHAALNVAGHATRVSLAQLRKDYLPIVLEAARGISEALGAARRGSR